VRPEQNDDARNERLGYPARLQALACPAELPARPSRPM